jgi:hypothetical protein
MRLWAHRKLIIFAASQFDVNTYEMVAVSDLVRSCLTKFTSLVFSAALADHAQEVSLQRWKDEMGRLRIWSANIGAHQRGQSSLDFRLRDASHIRSQTINLLQGLEDLLNDLKEVLEEDSDDENPENIENLEDDNTTEIQQLHKNIVETIHHIYRMSMIIRTPAHHDRLLGTDKLDAQPFKHWAHNHASNKYPLADAGVLECVSSAMALQRAILKYRERHHAKLSQNLDDVNEGDQKSTILSETVVTDICHDLPPGSNDLISVADTSETQTSFAGTLINGTGATTIPPLPKEGTGKNPFECPYCFLIISVRDTRAWARHIFRDLMPYVCIFPGCSGKLYESRRQWYGHVENAHADSMRAFKFDCSICKDSFSTAMYERHVSRHLEELALFLLPRTAEDEEDNDQDTDKEAASVMSDESSQGSYDHESQTQFIGNQLLGSKILANTEPLLESDSEGSGEPGMPDVEDNKTDEHKKKKHTSPASSQRSSIETSIIPPEELNSVSDQLLALDNICGNDDTGHKERTNTSTSTIDSNPVLKKQFLKHQAKLIHLRQEYSISRTELGNWPNDNEYKKDDCVRLFRSATSLMESFSDLAARYQLDAGEVSAQIQELQDMMDQLYLMLVGS